MEELEVIGYGSKKGTFGRGEVGAGVLRGNEIENGGSARIGGAVNCCCAEMSLGGRVVEILGDTRHVWDFQIMCAFKKVSVFRVNLGQSLTRSSAVFPAKFVLLFIESRR